MKSILTTLFLAAAVSLAHAGTSAAKNPKNPVAPAPVPGCDAMSYTFVELGYLHFDDHRLGNTDGGYIDLQYDVGHNLFLEGSYSVTDGDNGYREGGAGIGFYLPISSKFHFVARTGWANTDTDISDSENEWYISPGFRYQVTCNLEIYARAYLHIPENGDSNWSGGIGAVYWVSPKVGLVVAGAVGEQDIWSAQAGIRVKL